MRSVFEGFLAGSIAICLYLYLNDNGPIVAQEARVVALCDGRYMTAMEEDQLPLSCGMVESIDHLFIAHFE